MALEDKVKDIIVEQLGVNADQVNPAASVIEALGAGSLEPGGRGFAGHCRTRYGF